MNSRIAITSDHAGYEMKKALIVHLKEKGLDLVDLGTNSTEAADYPDYGHKLGEAIGGGKYSIGISICGSGNGINMTTNKHKGVRGAICWNEEIARLAKLHNNANICSLPARFIDLETAKKIVDIFLDTGFEGGRHKKRIQKIDI